MYVQLFPNEACKSTMNGIVSSLVNSTSGDARVFGISVRKQRSLAMAQLGVVPQEINFNQFERPFNIVVNHGGYYGVPRHVARERAEVYLKKLSLWDNAFGAARQLAAGVQRRRIIPR